MTVITTQPGGFTNLVGSTLAGGTYSASYGGTLDLNIGGAIVTDAATIQLVNDLAHGSNAIASFNAATGTYVPIESTLLTIAPSGVLSIIGDTYATNNTLTVHGRITLGAYAAASSQLSTPNLNIAPGGVVSLTGTNANLATLSGGAITNNGEIVANGSGGGSVTAPPGGYALLQSSITGTGSILVGTGVPYTPPIISPKTTVYIGVTLELAGAVAENVGFADSTGTLVLDAPQSFSGSILFDTAGYTITTAGGRTITSGDSIVLPGISLSSISGFQYVGTSSGGTLEIEQGSNAINLHFSGNYSTSSFSLSAGSQQFSTSPPSLVINELGPAQTAPYTAAEIVFSYQVGSLASSTPVADAAAAIAGNLDALQSIAAAGLLSSITLTDSVTPTLSITGAQLASDATALGDIAGSFGLAITGATTAGALTGAVLPHVTSVGVTDSAADVALQLNNIEVFAAAGKLTGITLTDSGIPTLAVSSTQIVQDALALNAISGNYTLSVPGVAAAVATFVAQQDASGRGANAIALDYPGTAPSGGNSVIGFQSASFSAGFNAVVVDGPRSSYAIQIDSAGVTTIKDIGVGDATFGQTVSISGESYILFNGANLGLAAPNSAAALTTPPGSTTPVLNYPNDIYFVLNQADAQLAQFYSSLLPWEPQPALSGLEYWVNRLNAGMSLTAIAQSFINTPYFQQTFGDPGTTHAQHLAYVQLLYSHILGMTLGASEAGVLYWTNDMDSGVLTGATTLISFTNAAATTATSNALSGATAGGGTGWLIDPAVTGGYADPGAQMAAATVLAQAAASNFYNLSLIDPTSVNVGGVSASGITVTPGAVLLAGAAKTGTMITLASSFAQATLTGSGYSVHDGLGTDSITVTGANNTLFLGSASTDHLGLALGGNTAIAGFAPGHGSVLAVSRHGQRDGGDAARWHEHGGAGQQP